MLGIRGIFQDLRLDFIVVRSYFLRKNRIQVGSQNPPGEFSMGYLGMFSMEKSLGSFGRGSGGVKSLGMFKKKAGFGNEGFSNLKNSVTVFLGVREKSSSGYGTIQSKPFHDPKEQNSSIF